MFYSLLELMVWGRKSRTYKRWIYGKRKQRRPPKPRVQLYSFPIIYLANKEERQHV
jgi:5'-3' exonuclease